MELILILEHLASQLAVNLITFLQKVVEVVGEEWPLEDELVVQVAVQVAVISFRVLGHQPQHQVKQHNQEQTQVLL